MRRQHYCTVSGCVKFYWILSDPLQSFVEREVLVWFFLVPELLFSAIFKRKTKSLKGQEGGRGGVGVCTEVW